MTQQSTATPGDSTERGSARAPDALARSVPLIAVDGLVSAPRALVVDLRSPSEFAVDRLPGAVNVPLFDDAERALIGLLYKTVSPGVAFARGREVAGGRIESLVAEIAAAAGWDVPRADLGRELGELTAGGIERMEAELAGHAASELPARPVVLHCWRGGLRSKSVVALLRRLGFDEALALAGGYKAWRRQVCEEIDRWEAPRAFVLRGLTGVGKTLVLRALELARPGWTFDLEAQAGHRSSLLGMVGLEPVSQKAFETRVYERIRAGFPGPVVLEGESRKVGDAVVPRSVWRALSGGTNIELTAPLERRVQVLVDDYLADERGLPELRRQLAAVEERMRDAPLVGLFDAGRTTELVELLLERYYDPLYLHSERKKAYAVTIDSSDPERAAREVAEWIERGNPPELPATAGR